MWAWFGVEKNTGVKSENIPFPDFTRVDCERPRIYPGVDPELNPRGRLRWLLYSTPPSQDLPPLLWLCEVYLAPRICLSIPEYTTLFNNYMGPSQHLPLPEFTPPYSQNISLLPFLQLYANFLESTSQSPNMPLFGRNYVYIVDNLPLAPRTEKYSGIA